MLLHPVHTARRALRQARCSAAGASVSQAAGPMDEELVTTSIRNGVGEIVLNRPKALNSLNTPMITRLAEIYSAWGQPGSGVHCILLKGAGGKAFCAGGDVKAAVTSAASGSPSAALDFFRWEYRTDHLAARLPMPQVALLDGIVMGGGAGLSMHAPFKVATERTLLAMPECAIGLFPDVGMTQVLARLPGELGTYLALTGARLKGADVKHAGLATHYLPSAALPALEARLHQLGPRARDLAEVEAVLAEAEAAAGGAPEGSILGRLPAINKCFGKASVVEVAAALAEDEWDPEFSRGAHTELTRGSPLSAAVSFEYLHRARGARWGLAQCLAHDYGLVQHFCTGRGDFFEGVRAKLIDKDDKPAWKYATLQEVPRAVVESFMQPLDPSDQPDLSLPWEAAGGAGASRL